MTKAVFIDTDGRFTFHSYGDDWDLGNPRPGQYIWARRGRQEWQVCKGGKRRGNTLSWPTGTVEGYRDAKDRLGRPMKAPVYADVPDDQVLKELGQMMMCRAFKSREAFDLFHAVDA